MRKLTTRWYYTLKEIAEQYGFVDSLEKTPAVGLATFCANVASSESAITDPTVWTSIDTTENKAMWGSYLWPEFAESTILYVDKEVNPWELGNEEEPSEEEVWERLKPILPRIVRWLKESTERYSTLITAYEGVKANLMGKVQTISNDQGEMETSSSSNSEGSDSRLELHNDTPQSGGDFTTDPYVSDARKTSGSNSSDNESNSSSTNSSTTTVSSDVTTPIERLNEVRQKLHNLYADWSEEFAQFVIYAD